MATFSLGSGATPSAPGVYVNERAGVVANAAIANFSTVYMLVEAEESVSVTNFPFSVPTPITSLNDYFALIGGIVPENRIPLLSYNCVNEFFQNAQVGDLRVVRVGTPNQIVEIEILPSGTKQSSAGLPSNLQAGDTVYVQLILNGNRLVAGDGSTGYTANGEWLGVPVTIPVDYISGDEVNNRKISAVIVEAIASAIETNPSVSSSVYVRESGLVVDQDPVKNAGSESGYITLAATTFDAAVSVIPQTLPVGAEEVLMQNTYDIMNIVGQQQNLTRVPQDYIQCIETAFDGQQDQGYLITPTAYAQFDAAGRTEVGAAAATLCASNNFKWMALADAGPFYITDVNKFSAYAPHEAAADLISGMKYLVDNAIYEWVGEDVTYARLPYQALVASPTAKTAIDESTSGAIAAGEKVGLLDSTIYSADTSGVDAKVELVSPNYWPVTYKIEKVTFSGATGNMATELGSTSGEVYVVAPPYNSMETGDYSKNHVFFAATASQAVSVLNEVIALGGTEFVTTAPAEAINFTSGGTCTITYDAPFYSFPEAINGQSSNLIQNVSGDAQYVNTLHLPATLQNPTETYRLGFVSRTIYNANTSVTAGTGAYAGAAVITCRDHGLVNGQKVFFTRSVTTSSKTVFRATSKATQFAYYVTVVDSNNIVLSESLSAYTGKAYVPFASGIQAHTPTVLYTKLLGGQETAVALSELSVIPFVRGRKYGLASGSIAETAAAAGVAPTNSDVETHIYFNSSINALSNTLISPYGETADAAWKSELTLIAAGSSPVATVENFYCTPTVSQSYASAAYLVPAMLVEGGTYTAGVDAASGVIAPSSYVSALSSPAPATGTDLEALKEMLLGVYFNVDANGVAPDGTTAVVSGDKIGVIYDGTTYSWLVVSNGDEPTALAQPFFGSQVAMEFTAEVTPPKELWRFDAVTSTEIISDALRGVGFNGVPQAVFIEAGVDNVNRLEADSQRYFDAFGFIAFYGSYIQNASGQFIPPSPYVTGVALRRYRAEGYQFPPAGVKYQLSDAVGVQIPVNSAQQNLLNPVGCNVIRTLPGYPQTAVFIWGGRTRVNQKDAQQRLYQFVNTRVILNVVYGSLRTAFDTQIFNVIDGFGVAFNQIISVGNSILNQLYIRGALFGARPADAFQVICDNRINPPASLENGLINAKVFVTPVPTLERIEVDQIRVAIGQMSNELDAQGLGTNNAII